MVLGGRPDRNVLTHSTPSVRCFSRLPLPALAPALATGPPMRRTTDASNASSVVSHSMATTPRSVAAMKTGPQGLSRVVVIARGSFIDGV